MTPGDAVYRAAQRADLLRFGARSRHPLGFGWLTGDGSLDPARPVELWITCRMTHVAALGMPGRGAAAPGGPAPEALAALAGHGVRALGGPLHDERHGGWFAAVDPEGPVGPDQGGLRARLRGPGGVLGDPRGGAAAAGRCSPTPSTCRCSTSGTTARASSTRSGTGPGPRSRLPRRQRQHAHRRGLPRGRRRHRRRRLARAGGPDRRPRRSSGPPTTGGASPSTSTPRGCRCSTTTGTGPPIGSGPTARRSATGSSGPGCWSRSRARSASTAAGCGTPPWRSTTAPWPTAGPPTAPTGFVYTTDWDGSTRRPRAGCTGCWPRRSTRRRRWAGSPASERYAEDAARAGGATPTATSSTTSAGRGSTSSTPQPAGGRGVVGEARRLPRLPGGAVPGPAPRAVVRQRTRRRRPATPAGRPARLTSARRRAVG